MSTSETLRQHRTQGACILQAADAEARKYEVAQQAEQSAFVAGIADLESAVTAVQTYTDMSSSKAVHEEVTKQPCCTSLFVLCWLGKHVNWRVAINGPSYQRMCMLLCKI